MVNYFLMLRLSYIAYWGTRQLHLYPSRRGQPVLEMNSCASFWSNSLRGAACMGRARNGDFVGGPYSPGCAIHRVHRTKLVTKHCKRGRKGYEFLTQDFVV